MTSRRASSRRPAAVLLALLLGLWLASVAPAAAASEETSESLARAYLDRTPTSSMAVAVLHAGEVEVRGYQRDGQGPAVDGDTPFRIASMSKSFTATLVMLLAERGDLDLDAPLSAVVPEFAMGDDRAGQITLRMLLAHTSGIGGGSTRDLGQPASTDPEVLLADLRDETLGSTPGTEHVYSNTGYALAAVAVERSTGQDFAELMRAELLDPLGMDRTTTVPGCATPVEGLGSGHTALFGRTLRYPEPADNCLGSGGMVSTAEDIATWLRFQSGDGLTQDGDRLLGVEALRALHTAQPGTEGVGGYGLGWSFAEQDGVRFLEHSGAMVTWTSHMSIVRAPDGRPTGDAAVVLADTVGAPGLLARALAADAAGATGTIPDQPLLRPATVFGALLVLLAVAGTLGLARSRSWPARRRRAVPRATGLLGLAAVAALCVVLPSLLARYAYGSVMGLTTAWHWGAGLLPEGVLLIALTGLTSLVVLLARLVSVTRSRPATRPDRTGSGTAISSRGCNTLI
ncbi:serine hydrolase domain-containing protein [Serinicoccus kebangsaanensis]|uniref:serine hydrolase domain-containing protein n=1 Tax=Serinicoccus kebangsaanensis TaxID=2602069 RepID=UPI00124C9C6E|nr:serine hydrolase [Serinicoccus kebangsaanensis]